MQFKSGTLNNPIRAEPNWPSVLVAGAYQTGVVLMRNLVRRRVRVSCFDCDPTTEGFRTVYGRAFQCPNPDHDLSAWQAFMIEMAHKIGGKPVLIPSADQFVTAIAASAAQLEPHYTFCGIGSATQSLLATKERQYDIAGSNGLAVPRTAFVRSVEDAVSFATTARYPCLLKPLHARLWEQSSKENPLHGCKLLLSHSFEELIAAYKKCHDLTPEVIIQEIIEGPDTSKYVYLSCYGMRGQRLGSCIVRQIRTNPIYFGSASVVEPVRDQEIDACCDRFLRAIGYVGICEIEVKRDTRDGRIKMIEANPRYSVTADAAPYDGVDLGWLHYLDLIGVDVAETKQRQRSFRHIVLRRDFAAIGSYRKAGLLSWYGLFRSYLPPVKFFDFDLRDYRLTARTIRYLIRMMVGSVLRKLHLKPRPKNEPDHVDKLTPH